MGCATDALRHLLLRLDLHVDISGTGLDGSYEPFLGHLHGLYLTALLREILQRRLLCSNLAYAAGCNERNVRGKKFCNLLWIKVTSVETDLSHLAAVQSIIDLLQGQVLYGSTNHFLTSITLQLLRQQGHRWSHHLSRS